jgi:hypothetical protein
VGRCFSVVGIDSALVVASDVSGQLSDTRRALENRRCGDRNCRFHPLFIESLNEEADSSIARGPGFESGGSCRELGFRTESDFIRHALQAALNGADEPRPG